MNKNMPLTFSHLYKYSSAAKILNVFFFSFLVSCFLFSVSYTVGNLVCSKNSQIYELKGVNGYNPAKQTTVITGRQPKAEVKYFFCPRDLKSLASY